MSYKRTLIICVAFFGLILTSISISFGINYLMDHNKWLGLILGILFMITGLISYQYGKRHTFFYILAFILNMIGVGLSITAYYVLKAFSLEFYDFVFAISVSMMMLIGFGLIHSLKVIQKHPKIYVSLIIVISFIVSLVLWISVDHFTGLSFYLLNIIYFFMVGMIKSSESLNDLSKELALVSFGSFLLVSIIVLIILTEGEALSGLDFNVSLNKKKKM